jgi:hypothetical protein
MTIRHLAISAASASLICMTRLPKKRGITQDGEDKSLILRQKNLSLGVQFIWVAITPMP